MKHLKKRFCPVLLALLLLLTGCGAYEYEIPEDAYTSVGGQYVGGEITFGNQTFSSQVERLTLYLQIESTDVLDLSVLSRCSNLRSLSIHVTIVPRIFIDSYKDAHIAEQQPVDLSPLTSLVNLESLELNVGRIKDLTPVSCLQNLTTLVLWIDGEADLSPLAASSLTALAIGGRGTVDLTPVARMPALQSLRVDVYDAAWNTPDLSQLSGAPCLESLSTGASRGLKDLKDVPLRKLVDLNDTGDFLENLPDLMTLEYLEFSDEQLGSIQSLLQRPAAIARIVLEVGAQEIENYAVIDSADDPLLDYLITSIPVEQLRRYLSVEGTSIAVVVDQNRPAKPE